MGQGVAPMSPRRLVSRATVLLIACAAFAAIVADVARAEVLSMTSAEGSVIETDRSYPSTRFIGADSIWLYQTYPMSIECNPPRACYASSQLTNYHFSCAPWRYVVVVEQFSMDLNGNVVKHEFQAPGGELRYFTSGDVVERFCGAVPDWSDLREMREQQKPDPPAKPDRPAKPGKR